MSEGKLLFYGVNWCGDCQRVLSYLKDEQIHFEFINIDYDKPGEQFVLKHNRGYRSVPTIVFPDGDILVEPSVSDLAAKINS